MIEYFIFPIILYIYINFNYYVSSLYFQGLKPRIYDRGDRLVQKHFYPRLMDSLEPVSNRHLPEHERTNTYYDLFIEDDNDRFYDQELQVLQLTGTVIQFYNNEYSSRTSLLNCT